MTIEKVFDLQQTIENPIPKLKELVGRPVGINLEPIAPKTNMMSEKVEISQEEQALLKRYKSRRTRSRFYLLYR